MSRGILNALTIDLEEWFQVAAFAPYISRDAWEHLESRVERITERLLLILSRCEVKATFFVLGWVAERHPGLVRRIASLGHEIASHGYSHKLVYQQTREEFKYETHRSKQFLESLLGQAVQGYRASTYSITPQSLWALDILIEEGFQYDSSIFPIRHPQYGMPGTERFPYLFTTPSGRTIVEFPLTTAAAAGMVLPVAGGGYFRQFPYLYTKLGLTAVNRLEKRPAIFYFHPWELDPGQPRVSWAPILARLRHYNNIGKTEARLLKLLKEFEFTTVKQVLQNEGLLGEPVELRTAA